MKKLLIMILSTLLILGVGVENISAETTELTDFEITADYSGLLLPKDNGSFDRNTLIVEPNKIQDFALSYYIYLYTFDKCKYYYESATNKWYDYKDELEISINMMDFKDVVWIGYDYRYMIPNETYTIDKNSINVTLNGNKINYKNERDYSSYNFISYPLEDSFDTTLSYDEQFTTIFIKHIISVYDFNNTGSMTLTYSKEPSTFEWQVPASTTITQTEKEIKGLAVTNCNLTEDEYVMISILSKNNFNIINESNKAIRYFVRLESKGTNLKNGDQVLVTNKPTSQSLFSEVGMDTSINAGTYTDQLTFVAEFVQAKGDGDTIIEYRRIY